MSLRNILLIKSVVRPLCSNCQGVIVPKFHYSQGVAKKYDDAQKDTILKVMNTADPNVLSSYDITKGRLKTLSQWRENNGKLTCLSDIELIDGFSVKTATKLYNSILEGPAEKKEKVVSKIKGQVLQPNLSEDVRKSCETVVALHVAVSCVCWTQIRRSGFEVRQWRYHAIDYPDGKRFQITDIFDISWSIVRQLPLADIYVMKAEATTLRAAGSDPGNPKLLAVNLQKAQMVAMMVALLNAKGQASGDHPEGSTENKPKQNVYFLRPTLPYRLYGTLVGNERVSTDQTVEILLQELRDQTSSTLHAPQTSSTEGSKLHVPENLRTMFRSQPELQKDMLGQCLLLGLTFMDLCVYKDQGRLSRLLKGPGPAE